MLQSIPLGKCIFTTDVMHMANDVPHGNDNELVSIYLDITKTRGMRWHHILV